MNETILLIVAILASAIWILGMTFVISNQLMLMRLRKEGKIPSRSLAFQQAFLRGEYDHLPEVRRNRAIFALAARIFVAIVVLTSVGIAVSRISGDP